MMFSAYYLQKDAYFCLSGRHCVILDAKTDRYLGVDRREFELLSLQFEHEAEAASPPISSPGFRPPTCTLVDELVAAGILTMDRKNSKQILPTSFVLPVTNLLDADYRPPTLAELWALPPFIAGCMQSQHWLNRQIFHATLTTVQSRAARGRHKQRLSAERLHALVSTFRSLRMYFPHKYLCFFDSLALLNFLAFYGSYPTWVFGVQAEPFCAHCWVQQDNVLLNDTVERVSMYTPIMTV